MKTIAILFFLSACSGSGGGESGSALAPSQEASEVIVSAQVQIPNDIKEELADQPQYQIDASEIELLYAEGASVNWR